MPLAPLIIAFRALLHTIQLSTKIQVLERLRYAVNNKRGLGIWQLIHRSIRLW